MSAVVSVNTSGVLVARTPAEVQSGTSTLSNPPAWFATIFSRGPAGGQELGVHLLGEHRDHRVAALTTSEQLLARDPELVLVTVRRSAPCRRASGCVHDRAGHQHVRSAHVGLAPRLLGEGWGFPRLARAGSRAGHEDVESIASDAERAPGILETDRLRLRPMRSRTSTRWRPCSWGTRVSMRLYPGRSTARWLGSGWSASSSGSNGWVRAARGGERATGEVMGDCGPMLQETATGGSWSSVAHPAGPAGEGDRDRGGRACRDEAWAALDIERLISIIRPENVPSWSVARGARILAVVRRRARRDGACAVVDGTRVCVSP